MVDAAKERSALSNQVGASSPNQGVSVGGEPKLREGLRMTFPEHARERGPGGAPGIWIVSLLLVLADCAWSGSGNGHWGTTATDHGGAATTSVRSQDDTSIPRAAPSETTVARARGARSRRGPTSPTTELGARDDGRAKLSAVAAKEPVRDPCARSAGRERA
jgi:hypothetical protein